MCPKEIKYGVMLADFDFITESKEAIDPSALPNVRCQVKSDKEMKHEPGTMGFRAPEVGHMTDSVIYLFRFAYYGFFTKSNSAEVCLLQIIVIVGEVLLH